MNRPVGRRPHPESLLLVLAIAWLVYVFARHAWEASMVVDGTRWFWLDDDQMISMRYARNLAEGAGLVWNPGARVEGYSNPGWTLVMSLVHRFGFSDATAALAVKAIALGLTIGVVLQTRRLTRLFVPDARALLVVPTLCLVTSFDVVFWAAEGFETMAIAALQLAFVNRALRRHDDPWAFVALGAMAIVRSDLLYLWAGNAALLIAVAGPSRALFVRLGLSLIPVAGHLAFRLAYYGEWLPNTYHLKVAGLQTKLEFGGRYVATFAESHVLPLVLAAAGALTRVDDERDRRLWVGMAAIATTGLYCMVVGGDSFRGGRFFAPSLPVLFALATVAITRLAPTGPGRAAWIAALLGVSLPWTVEPRQRIAPRGTNGDPDIAFVLGLTLRVNARPESVVAVFPAGIIPYFSRLPALDILGKNDYDVARLDPRPGGQLAHSKYSAELTLGDAPDLVAAARPHAVVLEAPKMRKKPGAPRYVFDVLASPEFRERYLPHPVQHRDLLRLSAVYTHEDSPEFQRRTAWTALRFDR